jgi:hypothetical protein
VRRHHANERSWQRDRLHRRVCRQADGEPKKDAGTAAWLTRLAAPADEHSGQSYADCRWYKRPQLDRAVEECRPSEDENQKELSRAPHRLRA